MYVEYSFFKCQFDNDIFNFLFACEFDFTIKHFSNNKVILRINILYADVDKFNSIMLRRYPFLKYEV